MRVGRGPELVSDIDIWWPVRVGGPSVHEWQLRIQDIQIGRQSRWTCDVGPLGGLATEIDGVLGVRPSDGSGRVTVVFGDLKAPAQSSWIRGSPVIEKFVYVIQGL